MRVLRRTFIGQPALEGLRREGPATLSALDLQVALGLAWAEADLALVRSTLDGIGAERVAADAILSAFHAATLEVRPFPPPQG